MDPLVGKFVRSNRTFNLECCKVDGQVVFPGDFYIPKIYRNQVFRVQDVKDDLVTLSNISTSDYKTCEVDMSDIEDFKVLSKSEVDSL